MYSVLFLIFLVYVIFIIREYSKGKNICYFLWRIKFKLGLFFLDIFFGSRVSCFFNIKFFFY